MAFYAEMVRRGSWLVNDANMIFYYHKVLEEKYQEYCAAKKKEYDDWYSTLSDDDRKKEDDRIRREKEESRRGTMRALRGLIMMSAAMFDMAERSRGVHDSHIMSELRDFMEV